MERKAFMCDMIRTELEDIVGRGERLHQVTADRADLRRGLFLDRPYVGGSRPDPAGMPDIIVRPGSAPRKSPKF